VWITLGVLSSSPESDNCLKNVVLLGLFLWLLSLDSSSSSSIVNGPTDCLGTWTLPPYVLAFVLPFPIFGIVLVLVFKEDFSLSFSSLAFFFLICNASNARTEYIFVGPVLHAAILRRSSLVNSGSSDSLLVRLGRSYFIVTFVRLWTVRLASLSLSIPAAYDELRDMLDLGVLDIVRNDYYVRSMLLEVCY